MTNDYLHPSEIARLVLGFLKEKELKKTYDTLLRECPDLQEFWKLLYSGTVPSTSVMGFTLTDMLNGFCSMKLAAFHQAIRKTDVACERAKLNLRLVPECHIEGPSQTTSGSSQLSKSSADVRAPLQSSTSAVSLPSQDSSNVGLSSAISSSDHSKDVTSSGSTMEENKIDPTTKTPPAPDAVAELQDPLERLLEETKLHEKLAESINRAMKDSSFLDELDEAIGGSDIDTEKRTEGSSAPEKEIVRANINDVVALTTCDPKFEELLSLVEQDAPSILHPAGSNGDKTQDSEAPHSNSINHPSVWISETLQGRNQTPASAHSQEVTRRNSIDKSSLNPNDSANLCVMDTTWNNHKISMSDGADPPPCLNGSSTNNLDIASVSGLMPPPATPMKCSRRSRLKRVPKKSVHKPKDLFYKNSLGKDLGINKVEDVSSRVPQISESDCISKSHNGTPVYLNHQNADRNIDDQENLSRIHVSGQTKEQHDVRDASAAQLSHQRIMNQDVNPTENSSHRISRIDTSSYGKASCNNNETKDGGNGKTSSLSESDDSPCLSIICSSSGCTSSAVSAIASDNNKQKLIPEAVHVSSAPTTCTMDENSLSVFSLIEKNIAEMHGEIFIPRHLRNQQNVAGNATMTNPVSTAVTSAVTPASYSTPVSVASSCAISPAVTTVHTLNVAQGLENKTSDVKGKVLADENVEINVTTLERDCSPERPETSLPLSASHFQEGQTHENDNASVHSDQSDSDFENRLSTPDAILVKPIGPYSSILQRNFDVVDQCLQKCLGRLVNNQASTAPVRPLLQQDDQRNDTIKTSDNHDTGAVDINRPGLAKKTQENQRLIKDLHSSEASEVEDLNRQNSSSQEEKIQASKATISELKMSNNPKLNCNHTRTVPFICSKTSCGEKWKRKYQEPSGTNECSSLPAVLPSMKQSSESPDSTYQSQISKSDFKPLATSTFLQPLPFMSPTSSELQGRRKVISVDCLHAPYIPDHCKKVPSRRITPVEVSSWTPSPLQVSSPSSPANLLIDIPSSPAVPASPMLMSSHTIPTSPLAQSSYAGPLSPSVTTCHRKSLERSQTSLVKDQQLLSFCTDKHDEERTKPEFGSSSLPVKETDNRSSESEMSTLGIKMPPSPSKRKPRRLLPKMLSAFTSKSRRENSYTSPIAKNMTFDDAKTVSSSSDLSQPSEAEAFRILKSHLFTYTKPQPKQEITSSGQVLKNSPLSKCACISRNTCKHRKGKGRRSPVIGKAGWPSAKETRENGIGPQIDLGQKTDTENISEVLANCEEDSGTFTKNKSSSRNMATESVSIPLSHSIQKEKVNGCAFRVVGTVEFQSPEKKSSDTNLHVQLRHTDGVKENHVNEVLTLSAKVQNDLSSQEKMCQNKESDLHKTKLNWNDSLDYFKKCADSDQSKGFNNSKVHSLSDGDDLCQNQKNSSDVEQIKAKPPLHEPNLLSGDKSTDHLPQSVNPSEEIAGELSLPHPVTAFSGETVDNIDKESTLIESEVNISQRNDSAEGRPEVDTKTITEVSAPYFPELSNTHDFFKGKFFRSQDIAKAPSHGIEINISPPIEKTSNQICLEPSDSQESNKTSCADLKLVSESHIQVHNSANLSPSLRSGPLSLMSGEVSLLRQAMNECDIPSILDESDISLITPQCSDAIIEEPRLASSIQPLTQVDSRLDNKKDVSSERNDEMNDAALKTSTIKQIQPIINHFSGCPPTRALASLQRKAQCGFTESTCNSRYMPICPKTLPKGSAVVYAQHAGEIVPFLIPPSGLPIMLPQPQIPVSSPIPNIPVAPLPVVAHVVASAASSDKVPDQQGLQTPPRSHPKKKVLSSERAIKGKGSTGADNRKPQQSPKRATKGNSSTVADNYTPKQKIGVRRKGFCSTSENQTSSYFKRGLRERKTSKVAQVSATPDCTELPESTYESDGSNGNIDAEKVIAVAKNTCHDALTEPKVKKACASEVEVVHSAVKNLKKTNPENESSEVRKGETKSVKGHKEKLLKSQRVSQCEGERSKGNSLNTSLSGSKSKKVKSRTVYERKNGHQRAASIERETDDIIKDESSLAGQATQNISSDNNNGTKRHVEDTDVLGLKQKGFSNSSREKLSLNDVNNQLEVIDNGMKKQRERVRDCKDILGSEELGFPNLLIEIPSLDYGNKQLDVSEDKLKGDFIGPEEKQNINRKTKNKKVNTRAGKRDTNSNGSSRVNAKGERILDLSKDEENKQEQGQKMEKSVVSLKNHTRAEKESGVDAKHSIDKLQEVPSERVSVKAVDRGKITGQKAKKTDDVVEREIVSLHKTSKTLNSCSRKSGFEGTERNDLFGNEDQKNSKSESCRGHDIVKGGKEFGNIWKERKILCTEEGETSDTLLDNSQKEDMKIQGSNPLPTDDMRSVVTGSKLEKLITPDPEEMRESFISPFSVQKDKINVKGQVKKLTNIFDIVKNVFTGLEKNKLKALSKIQGSEKKESTARRRSFRSATVFGCKDYYENSDEDDSDEVISDMSLSAESLKNQSLLSPGNWKSSSGSEKSRNCTTRGEGRGRCISQSQERNNHTPGSQERRKSTPESQEKNSHTPGSQERKKHTPRSQERENYTPESQERRKGSTPRSQGRKKCLMSRRKNEETKPNLKTIDINKEKKIISRQMVAIQIFNLCDEIISMVLVDHNPFPIYEPEGKSQHISDGTPKSRRAKLRLRKTDSGAVKKTCVKTVKGGTSSTVEIFNDKGKSPPPSDHLGGDDIYSVEQNELDRAVLALQQADTSWTQLDWVSREFEPEKSHSPIKYKNCEKSTIPAVNSAHEGIALMNTFSNPKAICDSEKAFPRNSIEIDFQNNIKSVETLSHSHVSESPINAAVKPSDDSTEMLSRKNYEKSRQRKRKASPSCDKTAHSLKSCEKRRKQRRNQCQETVISKRSKRLENEKVGSVEFPKSSVNKKHVASTTGSISNSNSGNAFAIDSSSGVTSDFRQDDCAMRTPPSIPSNSASYLFSITETELNEMRLKALENSSESNHPLHENSKKEVLSGGLDLLSTVAVDASLLLALSQSQQQDISSDLSHRFTKPTSDSMVMGKASDETTVILSNAKVDNTKDGEGLRSTMSSGSSSHMSAIAKQSSQSFDQSSISMSQNFETESTSFSSSENISVSQSMRFSPSQGKSISLTAKKRLLKRLYKERKS